MTMTSPRGSARIYEFPVGGRRNSSRTDTAKLAETARLPIMEFGSGWYHDAAIQDAKPTGKR